MVMVATGYVQYSSLVYTRLRMKIIGDLQLDLLMRFY